jgi:hypothetical protein
MAGICSIHGQTGVGANGHAKFYIAISDGQEYNKCNGLHRVLDAKTLLDAR